MTCLVFPVFYVFISALFYFVLATSWIFGLCIHLVCCAQRQSHHCNQRSYSSAIGSLIVTWSNTRFFFKAWYFPNDKQAKSQGVCMYFCHFYRQNKKQNKVLEILIEKGSICGERKIWLAIQVDDSQNCYVKSYFACFLLLLPSPPPLFLKLQI